MWCRAPLRQATVLARLRACGLKYVGARPRPSVPICDDSSLDSLTAATSERDRDDLKPTEAQPGFAW